MGARGGDETVRDSQVQLSVGEPEDPQPDSLSSTEEDFYDEQPTIDKRYFQENAEGRESHNKYAAQNYDDYDDCSTERQADPV